MSHWGRVLLATLVSLMAYFTEFFFTIYCITDIIRYIDVENLGEGITDV